VSVSRMSSPLLSTWTRKRRICTFALCRLRKKTGCRQKRFWATKSPYRSGRLPTMSGCPYGGMNWKEVNPQWRQSGNTSPHGSIN
jgi:hypothetical protein